MEAAAILESLISGCATLSCQPFTPSSRCHFTHLARAAPCSQHDIISKGFFITSCRDCMANQRQKKARRRQGDASSTHMRLPEESSQNDHFGVVAVLLAYQVIVLAFRPEKARRALSAPFLPVRLSKSVPNLPMLQSLTGSLFSCLLPIPNRPSLRTMPPDTEGKSRALLTGPILRH